MLLKCPCQHCGSNIEFPAENRGEIHPCPHCGQDTYLLSNASKPSIPLPAIKTEVASRPRKTLRQLLAPPFTNFKAPILVLAGLILVGCFFWFGVFDIVKSRFDGSHEEALKCLADLRAGCEVGVSMNDLNVLHRRIQSTLELHPAALAPQNGERLLPLIYATELAWKSEIETKNDLDLWKFDMNYPGDLEVLEILEPELVARWAAPTNTASRADEKICKVYKTIVVSDGMGLIAKECSRLIGKK